MTRGEIQRTERIIESFDALRFDFQSEKMTKEAFTKTATPLIEEFGELPRSPKRRFCDYTSRKEFL
jgi:hypothetical protein